MSPRSLWSRFFSRIVSNRGKRLAPRKAVRQPGRRPAVEGLEDRLAPAAVWTGKADYAPGSTAIISGSGYQVGETVHLEVKLADGTVQGTPDNPWDVVDGGAGDLDGVADGNFQTIWYVEPTYATNQSLVAYATGLTSGEQASAAFTDAVKIYKATISPTTDTAGHTSSAYTLMITNDSSSTSEIPSATINVPMGYTNVVLGAVTPPSGQSWTASLASGVITLKGTGSFKLTPGQSVSLALTATSPSTAGSYEWTTST